MTAGYRLVRERELEKGDVPAGEILQMGDRYE